MSSIEESGKVRQSLQFNKPKVMVGLGITALAAGILLAGGALIAHYVFGLGIVGASIMGGSTLLPIGLGGLLILTRNAFSSKSGDKLQESAPSSDDVEVEKPSFTDKKDPVDSRYKTLFKAIFNDNPEEVERLLAEGNIEINARKEDGNTLLHEAALFGNVFAIEKLLNVEGIDVTAQNKYGDTALHIAVMCNKVASIRALVKAKKIDLTITNNDGKTPLDYAKTNEIRDLFPKS